MIVPESALGVCSVSESIENFLHSHCRTTFPERKYFYYYHNLTIILGKPMNLLTYFSEEKHDNVLKQRKKERKRDREKGRQRKKRDPARRKEREK